MILFSPQLEKLLCVFDLGREFGLFSLTELCFCQVVHTLFCLFYMLNPQMFCGIK